MSAGTVPRTPSQPFLLARRCLRALQLMSYGLDDDYHCICEPQAAAHSRRFVHAYMFAACMRACMHFLFQAMTAA